jgi:16S rRNA (uracil1498-N3)-methyltransferase
VPLPRFHAPEAGADRLATLSRDEAHHLVHVLRVRAGDEIVVFDGRGREWLARVDAATRSSVTVELISPRAPVAEPMVAVTIGLALLKGDRMDAAIRDATALGAAAIVPIASAHVAVPPRARRDDAARERWTRTAVAAAKQCGRAVVPAVSQVMTLEAAVGASAGARLLAALEPCADGLDAADLSRRPDAALLLVGPEGGWSEAEIAFLRARGAGAVRLGPRTLRAELAPVVALTTLWNAWK